MPGSPVIAFLTGMLVSAAYPALIVVFWGIVYVVGCILIIVQSPKVCKGIFAGSCSLGAMVGGALTSITSAAMGLTWFGAATGLLGSGIIGQTASAVLDVPLPANDASGPSSTPKKSNTQSSASGTSQQASKQSPASMEAVLATGVPAANNQSFGAVSRNMAERGPRPGRPPAGTILGVDGQPIAHDPPDNK